MMSARYHILANGVPFIRADSVTEACFLAARMMLLYPGFVFGIREGNYG